MTTNTDKIPRPVADALAATALTAILKAWNNPETRAKYEQWRKDND